MTLCCELVSAFRLFNQHLFKSREMISEPIGIAIVGGRRQNTLTKAVGDVLKIDQVKRPRWLVIGLRAKRTRRCVRRRGIDPDIRHARLDALLAEFKFGFFEPLYRFDAMACIRGCALGVELLFGVCRARASLRRCW